MISSDISVIYESIVRVYSDTEQYILSRKGRGKDWIACAQLHC